MTKTSLKYKRSNQDWAAAEETLQKAETDCTLSRREVEKLRSISCEKQKQCEESKNMHDKEMVTMKEKTEEYLKTSLPAVLDSLQGVSVGSGHYLREVWLRCVQAEQEAGKVIEGCQREMERIVEDISPEKDAEMVIEKFKTGNMPPSELQAPTKSNTMKRSKSSTKISSDPESQTLYQQKRQLQMKIESIEEKISKGNILCSGITNHYSLTTFVPGQKEMSGLQLMVQSYTSNPKYGDVSRFKEELDRATLTVQLHESDLYALNSELSSVNTRLEGIRRSSSFSQPALAMTRTRRERSPEGSVASSTPSHSSGYPSTASIGSTSDKDNDSIEEPSDYKRRIQTLLSQSDALYMPNMRASADLGLPSFVDPRPEEDEDFLPPPPDELLEDPPTPVYQNCQTSKFVALYAFDVCTEGNIPMVEGEQFYQVLEDQGGWTRVRRVDDRFFQDEGEGFVPTSFIQRL